MKVLVIGTWNESISKQFELDAQIVGKYLAKRKHSLVASPSSGIQGLVAKHYKEAGGNQFIGFYPDLDKMESIGEKVLVEPDKPIYTNEDYPVRNILQLREGDKILALTGGTGTLTESIVAVNDYNTPLLYLHGSSQIIDGFLNLDPAFAEKIYYSKNISEILMELD